MINKVCPYKHHQYFSAADWQLKFIKWLTYAESRAKPVKKKKIKSQKNITVGLKVLPVNQKISSLLLFKFGVFSSIIALNIYLGVFSIH